MARAGTNALSGEESAYLRQHADHPVHWQPFGDEAFAAAQQSGVPIFLSVGYAACHWCHVMAHESFDDPVLAEYLNEHFVSVKVDREERPDVDAVYMAATQAMSGEGGWPMSVFLTPEGQAFHAGTYFPPRPLAGRPSFREVLAAVNEVWTERRAEVYESAGQLATALTGRPVALGKSDELDAVELLHSSVRKLAEQEDPDFAGFGRAPKFPPSPVLGFRLRATADQGLTATEARAMAARTLAAMANSSLQDQLAGGFARYSVTADWSLPHYEKMLYDNAQLLRRYAEWLKLPQGADYPPVEAQQVLRATADFMIAELLRADGAFASSLDADSISGASGALHEGAAYTWTKAALIEALGQDDGVRLADLMNIGETEAPLHPGRELSRLDRQFLDAIRPTLLSNRASRPQPALDEKAVAGWNGLAVGSLVEAWAVTDEPRYLAAVIRAAETLLQTHWRGGVLTRLTGGSRPGLLEDYAWCAEGYFLLYSATGDPRWYQIAEDILLAASQAFVSANGVIDAIPVSAELLRAQGGVQGADPMDNATPSGVAAFAEVLVRYAALSGSFEHRELTEKILAQLSPLAERVPRAMGAVLGTLLAVDSGPWEVAVVGEQGAAELLKVARMIPLPGLVIAPSGRTVLADEELVPLLRGRGLGPAGEAAAYLCQGMVCQRPTSGPAELAAELAAAPR